MVTTTRRRKAAAVPTVELTQFTWIREKHCLVIEASDLKDTFGPDGLPIKFNVHSPKTDRTEQFRHTGVVMQDAEDIGAWLYVSVNEDCPIKTIVVYND